jgi:hypothetical protein
MECFTPPPLSDDELAFALDGIADEDIQRHLAGCPACISRLDAMRRFEGALQERLRRFDCPPPGVLVDYHAGMLDPDTAAAVEQHVADCPRCQEEMEMLAPLLNLSPQELVPDNIIPLYPAKNVFTVGSARVVGNVVLKGLDDETPHDVKAGSASIYLESMAAPKGYVLSGQVLDTQVSWAEAIAEVWQEGVPNQVRLLDEMAEFKFELTARTPITLYITSKSGLTLKVENIVLQD